MSLYPRAKLKPGRDGAVHAGHPWIFSGAISGIDETERGGIVEVADSKGGSLGIGTFHPGNSIRIRMIDSSPDTAINSAFFADRMRALFERKKPLIFPKSDAMRVVHADADYLPGLVVDMYGSCVVFQIHTAGMEKLREDILEGIFAALDPSSIVERSDVEARKQDHLKTLDPVTHYGKVDGPVEFTENKVLFLADPIRGQKTGFYLDQREARAISGRMTAGSRVINLFSYTGGASLTAALGKAKETINVDSSEPALLAAKAMFKLNGLDPEKDEYSFLAEDVFHYLMENNKELQSSKHSTPTFMICDPP
ncbi:MAG: class I SAM-dependent rRNA methyltransferase, partial [Spirochaetales bacterium]|nr:class I SAM-dependent rRNA methyltransferase [Spirochaetales bacterium]